MTKQIRNCSGFTFVEVMFSVVLLAILATAITAPYISGFRSLDVQAEHMILDSSLRSAMEVLIGIDFDTLNNGSSTVSVSGQNYTLTWNAVAVDLDGDSTPEPNAMQITVSITELPNRSLTTIVVDHEGKVGKIS